MVITRSVYDMYEKNNIMKSQNKFYNNIWISTNYNNN